MRPMLFALAIALTASLFSTPRTTAADRNWTNLLSRNLRDWSRSGEGKNPWRVAPEGTLVCEKGNGFLMPDHEFGDGTLKFEYRFRPNGEKKGFKAAVWARRTNQGGGCRVSLGDDCGALSASFQGASDRTKFIEDKPLANAARPIGEWNEVRMELDGRTVNVFINELLVASFSNCDSTTGLIALEAEDSVIEFREVMWKNGN